MIDVESLGMARIPKDKGVKIGNAHNVADIPEVPTAGDADCYYVEANRCALWWDYSNEKWWRLPSEERGEIIRETLENKVDRLEAKIDKLLSYLENK